MRFCKRTIAIALCLGSAVMFGFPAGQGKTPKKPADEQTIRVAVEMVSLPVVVTTRDGKRITDLRKEDFQVFEDGVQQDLVGFAATDEPVSVALTLDTSGSTELELARIQNEAIHFVNELHPDDSVSVLSFAEDVRLLQDFSIDRERNEYGIKETRAGGCTVEYEAVWLALKDVLQPVKERKALVLFTDGVDTCSRKASEKETLELAKETNATVYCVYFNTESDLYRRAGPTVGGLPVPGFPPIIGTSRPPVYGPGGSGSTHMEYMRGRNYLEKLSEYSGGVLFDGMSDLSGAFEQVARELASQYSIGYYSTNTKHDGKFRKVEVKVNKPGLVARTKKGYFAKKEKTT